MKNAIIFWIVVFALAIVVSSCGARQTERNKTKMETKTDFTGIFRNSGNSEEILKSDITFQSQYNNLVTDQSKLQSYEFTFEPEDLTKPATYIDPSGQKHVVENGKLHSKKTSEDKNVKTEKSGKSEKVLKSQQAKKAHNKASGEIKIKANGKKTEATKKTTRQESIFWKLFWLLIPIALIAIFLWIRKKV